VYKGWRRSHRFTILGNDAFEYDVILEREPESNVVSLTMEGAENFDFFRQPDFLKEPLLAGSYAVYKKETLIGEGTGKLCHIHRPEIIKIGKPPALLGMPPVAGLASIRLGQSLRSSHASLRHILPALVFASQSPYPGWQNVVKGNAGV
jgi:hypothetical protein